MLNEKVLKNEPMKYTIEGGADEGNWRREFHNEEDMVLLVVNEQRG